MADTEQLKNDLVRAVIEVIAIQWGPTNVAWSLTDDDAGWQPLDAEALNAAFAEGDCAVFLRNNAEERQPVVKVELPNPGLIRVRYTPPARIGQAAREKSESYTTPGQIRSSHADPGKGQGVGRLVAFLDIQDSLSQG